MNFEGYLLSFPKTGKVFPNKYINAQTFNATPLQRTEIKAYRDSNNLLHRTTSPNYKTKLTFSTVSLHLSDLKVIQDTLKSSYENYAQRKIKVKYWDDELLDYRTMTAYIPDVVYSKELIQDGDILYSSVEFTFIEY